MDINAPEARTKAAEILKAIHDLNICHAQDNQTEYALAAALALRFERLVNVDGPEAHFSDMCQISKQLISQLKDIFSNPVTSHAPKETAAS